MSDDHLAIMLVNFFREKYLLAGNTHLPALCAGEAPDEKLKINKLGPDCMPLGPCSVRDASLSTTSMKHSLQISMVFGRCQECSWRFLTTPPHFFFGRHIFFCRPLSIQPTTIACTPSVVNGWVNREGKGEGWR